MKYILSLFLIVSATLSYGQSSPARRVYNTDSLFEEINKRNAAAIGTAFPQFSVLLNNKKFTNNELKGKVVFINFWFAACHPCMEEMPDLNKLYKKFGSNNKFEYISFTFDSPEEIEKTRKKHNFKYKVLSISNEECHRLNLQNGFPFNIILGYDGTIKYAGNTSMDGQHNFSSYFEEIIYPIIERLLQQP